MHKLKAMKETLISCVQSQMADLANADTKELGEAIDMIKDLEEAMYYCSIVKAMEKQKEEDEMLEKAHLRSCPSYYTEKLGMHSPYERDMDRDMGRMYYPARNARGQFMPSGRKGYYDPAIHGGEAGAPVNYFHEKEFPFEMRDEREGRSPMSRRMYMESKEMHKDKNQKVKELEKYMQELSQDIVEMIEDASPEEKQMLERKLTHLTSKVAQLNQNG